MDTLRIRANGPLHGVIPVSGAKNSALKLMVASLLTSDTLTLRNVPSLADTHFMAKLLESLGTEVEWRKESGLCRLTSSRIVSHHAPYDLVRRMRATFNVLGPLLARRGEAVVSLPGGCAIGARPVDLHLHGFAALGADIEIAEGYVRARAGKGLHGAHITFPTVSVGATEHLLLAAVLAQGETVLENAAHEPEIADLAACLTAMGARIEGAGTSCVRIEGVASLSGTGHRVMPDRIEAGTYAIAVAMTGGALTLTGARPDDMRVLTALLTAAGIAVETGPEDAMRIARAVDDPIGPVDVTTGPFPAFPTDLQAPFMALMTRGEGVSTICETIFENRFMHVPELNRLGADIAVHGNRASVRGAADLRGAQTMATDLRASVCLVVAGLVAEGETHVNRVYHLDRGFEKLQEKLGGCGADLTRLQGRSV